MDEDKGKRKRVLTIGTPITELGIMPPQAIELEEAVLGAMLLEKEATGVVLLILKAESFYKEQNSKVFKAIHTLYKKGSPVDILTVTEELKRTGDLEFVGGAYYVSALTNRIASSANIEYHARVVEQKFINREIIRIGTSIIKKSYEAQADCFDILDSLQLELRQLTNFANTKAKHVGDLFTKMITEIKDVMENNKPTGIPSGYENIDKVTGGWQKGTLNILAARPSMGKTAFALAIAKNAAVDYKIPVLIFSIEMSAIQLTGRLSASSADISSTRINHKTVNHAELMELGGKCTKLINAPIYIDDSPSITFEQLRTTAIRMKYEHDIQMIVIDYLQLMKGSVKGGNREAEISDISRNLKILSKELDLPVIALSQLSRKVEERKTGEDAYRPILSDLRESGAIEQDADNVMMLFRPAYYGLFPNGYPYGTKTLETANLMLVDFVKGREIDLHEVPLLFYGIYMRVDNYDFDIKIEEAKIITEDKRLLDNGHTNQDQ